MKCNNHLTYRLMALLLTFSCVLCFAGCGQKNTILPPSEEESAISLESSANVGEGVGESVEEDISDLDFDVADVKELRLSYMSPRDETTLTLTGKKEIEAYFDSLGNYTIHPFEFESDSLSNPMMGGAGVFTITFTDGTVWEYSETMPRLQDEEIFHIFISSSNGRIFDSLWDFSVIPSLSAKIGTVEPKIYVNTYAYSDRRMTRLAPMPLDVLFDTDPVLLPGQSAVSTLRFEDNNAQVVVPSEISVALLREVDWDKVWGTGFNDTEWQIDAVEEKLEVNNLSFVLPNLEGKYYVMINAKFPSGNVNYMFQYRVTHMPEYFDDIGYGNGDNDVTVVRDDMSISIGRTGQNRKFADFILSLELKPSTNAGNAQLPVKNPFTLIFTNGDVVDAFRFTQGGILYNGEAFETTFPERIERLYERVTPANHITDFYIDYVLRGFLSKEVSRFTGAYPVKISEIEKLVVVEEGIDYFTRFDATSSLQDNTRWIENIVLAKNWQDRDNYNPRSALYSFEITMKDGTVYAIGEKLLINGEDSGWYTVLINSDEAAALANGITGDRTDRENSIRHGRSFTWENDDVIIWH